MQRSSGGRCYYSKKNLKFNLDEMKSLMSLKQQIRTTVQSYIDKKSDRDMTLSTLAQISEQIKEKISMIA